MLDKRDGAMDRSGRGRKTPKHACEGKGRKTGNAVSLCGRLLRMLAAVFVMPAPVVALCPVLVAALMAWVFLLGNKANPLSYAAYVVSAWAAAVLAVACVRGRPAQAVYDLLHRNRAIGRIVDDKDRRSAVGACIGLGVDVLWAAGNLAYGAWTTSLWLVTLGVYYLILAVARGALLRDIHLHDNARTAWAMRLCGALVAALTLVVTGFVTLTTHRQGGFSYPDIVIYAVAVYAFFALGTSIAGVVSNRHHERQSLFALSGANLANALVSVLALEMAMMSLFGAGESPLFVLTMNALTGAGVAAADIAIGIALIRRAARL